MKLLRLTPLPALLLAACGYTPLYAPSEGGANAAQYVQIGNVAMAAVEKNVGQRRVAQTVAQELKLDFPSAGPDMDTATITITEGTSTLAVQRTAAVQRAQINLSGNVIITNADGKRLLNTNIATNAAYNVENTPYSTESGKTFARLTAARNLAAEISRRLSLFYRTHPGGTAPVLAPAVTAPAAPTPVVSLTVPLPKL